MILHDSQQLAFDTLNLHMKLVEIQEKLDKKKQELRDLANGESFRVEVADVGSVYISPPRSRSTKKVLSVNEEKLDKVPEIKAMLISKKIISEDIKVIPSAKAAVKISPQIVTAFVSPPE